MGGQRLSLLLAVCLVAPLAASAAVPQNPVVALLRKQTQQYEKEAEKAKDEAVEYARKTERAAVGGGIAAKFAREAIARRGVQDWVVATGQVQRMLDNPAPGKAQEAGMKVAEPYRKAFQQYQASLLSYQQAALGFQERADSEGVTAQQLQAFADQYRMEGKSGKRKAEAFAQEAEMLLDQAEGFHETADRYRKTVSKIEHALPSIKQMEAQAIAHAKWAADPYNDPPPAKLVLYTVAPPLL